MFVRIWVDFYPLIDSDDKKCCLYFIGFANENVFIDYYIHLNLNLLRHYLCLITSYNGDFTSYSWNISLPACYVCLPLKGGLLQVMIHFLFYFSLTDMIHFVDNIEGIFFQINLLRTFYHINIDIKLQGDFILKYRPSLSLLKTSKDTRII